MAPRNTQKAGPSTATTRMTRARSKAVSAQPVPVGGPSLSANSEEEVEELLPPKKKRKTTHSSVAPEISVPATHSAISSTPAIADVMDLDNNVHISDKTASTSATRLTKTKKGSKAVSNTDSSNVLGASGSSNKERRERRCSLETVPLDILHEVRRLLTTYQVVHTERLLHVQIFDFLDHPREMLSLCRTSKSLRSILLSKGETEASWRKLRRRIEGLPDLPSHLNEVQYANLLFSFHCHVSSWPFATQRLATSY